MTEDANLEIILGIPGRWQTRGDLLNAIITQTDGLLFAGMVLFDPRTQDSYQLEVAPHDPAVYQAFVAASRGQIPQADLEAVAHHTLMLYLIGPGGTREAAQKLMLIAARLLKAGGIAVKVETAGIAHSASQWQMFASDASIWLCDAYTAYVRTQGAYCSCGMHNLGLRDAAVSDQVEGREVLHLLQTFLRYTALQEQGLGDGHTFSVDAQAPHYRLRHQEYTLYPPGDPFHNPFGVWFLSQTESKQKE